MGHEAVMMGLGDSWWRRWWWVALFCTMVGGVYFHSIGEKKQEASALAYRLEEMEKEKRLALQEKEDLSLQLESQNDPSWIEMVLMRDLGVVPEGWLKVHFKK
ncbi:MAG: hypothetical protein HY861_04445 [Chlamydiia bacterium]|nr:hypothetical protein [Chlamydiia bacterium]